MLSPRPWSSLRRRVVGVGGVSCHLVRRNACLLACCLLVAWCRMAVDISALDEVRSLPSRSWRSTFDSHRMDENYVFRGFPKREACGSRGPLAWMESTKYFPAQNSVSYLIPYLLRFVSFCSVSCSDVSFHFVAYRVLTFRFILFRFV